MAVLPDFQNRSIGSQLVRAGSTKRPTQSLPVPDASFMACELEPGALDGIQGRIELPQAFDDAI
jgi:predicted N-acetyltransferase YhbS